MPDQVSPPAGYQLDPPSVPAGYQLDAPPAAAAAPSFWDRAVDSVKNYASNLTHDMNPIEMLRGAKDAAASAVYHPVDTVSALGQAQGRVGQKAIDSFKGGDYATGVRHAINYLLPIIGPAIDAQGDQMATDPAAALAHATALGLNLALPDSPLVAAAAKRLPSAIPVIPKFRNQNAAVADAVDFARANDIPVSAATATGNRFVAGTQKLVDHSPIGSVVAENAQAAQNAGLTRVAGELADRAYPRTAVPETAADAVSSRFNQKINALRNEADSHYDVFRDAAKNNVELRSNGAGMEDIEMPVDLRPIKKNLQPLYDEMLQWMPVSSRNSSEGFAAIKGLVNGPDFMAAPVAEKGLSGLKSLARDAASPDLRNVSQGIGADAAQQLQASIDAAALKAGPDALAALKNGRSAHAEKMQVADTLGKLRDEPVQMFNQLTYKNDSGVDQLRVVAKQAPQEMSMVGRAYLENLFGKATADGGFDKAKTLAGQWENLGPETKKILFKNPMLVQDLDRFFLFAKKAAENPNPSGTALLNSIGGTAAYTFHDPVRGVPLIIGAGAVSKMLHSPAGVAALTEGLKVPVLNKAAAASAAAQILKVARSLKLGDAVKPAAAAENPSPIEQTGQTAEGLPQR